MAAAGELLVIRRHPGLREPLVIDPVHGSGNDGVRASAYDEQRRTALVGKIYGNRAFSAERGEKGLEKDAA